MTVKSKDQHEVFTCDTCGNESAPRIGLPDGWVQIAVRGQARLKDQYKQFCSRKCANALDGVPS